MIFIVEFVTKAYLCYRFSPIGRESVDKGMGRKEKEESARLARVLEMIYKQNKNKNRHTTKHTGNPQICLIMPVVRGWIKDDG